MGFNEKKPIPSLTKADLAVLNRLQQSKGSIVSDRALIQMLGDQREKLFPYGASPGGGTLSVSIGRLRKIGNHNIENIRGKGYRIK